MLSFAFSQGQKAGAAGVTVAFIYYHRLLIFGPGLAQSQDINRQVAPGYLPLPCSGTHGKINA